jgi:hypothetical protein
MRQPILLSPADFRDMPWKNGGGTTCELFRLPHAARPDDFALRLSIASVAQGGPFSAFPGVDRTLMLLEGAGMALQFADGRRAVLDKPLHLIDFPGEANVDCTLLGGPLRDFNVMVARDYGWARTHIVHVEAGQPLMCDGAVACWVYLLRGELTGAALRLAAGQLLLLPQGHAACLTAVTASVAIVVELTLLPCPSA